MARARLGGDHRELARRRAPCRPWPPGRRDRWPMRAMSAAPFGLRDQQTPSRPGFTTAARSSSVRPVSSGLTRTKNAQSRAARVVEQRGDVLARLRLLRRRDGILEIEDQRVGADRCGPWRTCARCRRGRTAASAASCAASAASAPCAGSEHTTSSRWLNPWCSKVTMPWPRPRLARAQRQHRRLAIGSCRPRTPAWESRPPPSRDCRPWCRAWCPAPTGRPPGPG